LLENARSLFEGKRSSKPVNAQSDPDRLYAKIGQLNMELYWLKKVWDRPLVKRQGWIVRGEVLTVSRQCKHLAVTRSVMYAHKKRQQGKVDGLECILLSLLDEEYTRHPYFGSRRMTKYLCALSHVVNRKRVQRLMQKLGFASVARPQHQQATSTA
jgi:putative transposase